MYGQFKPSPHTSEQEPSHLNPLWATSPFFGHRCWDFVVGVRGGLDHAVFFLLVIKFQNSLVGYRDVQITTFLSFLELRIVSHMARL